MVENKLSSCVWCGSDDRGTVGRIKEREEGGKKVILRDFRVEDTGKGVET